MAGLHEGATMRGLLAIAISAALAAPATAAVKSATEAGFAVESTETVNAPPDRVYAALVEIGRWWSSQHTQSGDAANFSLDPRAGGCLCERLKDGGSAQWMMVVQAQPGRLLRLKGALGPLQSAGVDGVLTWALKPAAGGTEVTLSYVVGGYRPGGLAELAGPVDGVLGEQLRRLKAYVETGFPR